MGAGDAGVVDSELRVPSRRAWRGRAPAGVRRLFRRNELVVNSQRTPEEDAELSRLSAETADLGFSTADFRDPDYALFVRKMAQHRRFRKPTLTPEEQAEQDRIADSIIDEILREEDGQ